MHITQLKIAGFKSFVDAVEVHFEEGLTGIVGPNGCGKSNILESLRWAMGATSARAMRGGEMDDLIFSGSSNRPARERCEVTLTLDNSARTAPAALNDEDVLEVKRMLRRGAGSTYKVNGRTVRAKDVQLLFADASTGANSPALVRQGQISELIASKPQNRRRILEEAAGIGGLNQRRHEAELKLRAALVNLEQLDQLIGEVDRQTAALKRQAGKARRYREMSAAADALEITIMAWRWRQAVDEREGAEQALKDAVRAVEDGLSLEAAAMSEETNCRAAIAPLRDAETEAAGKLGALKLELAQLDSQRRANSDEIRRLEADQVRIVEDLSRETNLREEASQTINRLRQSLADAPPMDEAAQTAQRRRLTEALTSARQALIQAEERADDCASRLAAADAEAQAARSILNREESRLASLVQQLAALRDDREKLGDQNALESALSKTRSDLLEAEEEYTEATQRAETFEAEAKQARLEEDKTIAPLQEAEKLVRTLEAELSGLDRLLKDTRGEDETPILTETRPGKGYERALAAALGDDLNAPRSITAPQYWSTHANHSDAEPLPDGIKSLADLVDAPAELVPRLKQCGLVTAKEGAALQSGLAHGQRLVSRAGDLWRWDGFIRTAKAPSAAAERLEQQARRDACKDELNSARKDVDKLYKRRESAREKAEKAQEAARSATKTVPDAASRASHAREMVLRAEQELERLFLRTASIDNNIARASEERDTVEKERDAARAAIGAEPSQTDRDVLEAARNTLREVRRSEREADNALSDFERDLERAVGRRRALERDLKDWERREQNADTRIAALADQRAQIRSQLELAMAAPEDLTERSEALARTIQFSETARRDAANALAQAETALRESEQRARRIRENAASARENQARMDARLEAAQRREEDVASQARNRFECELAILEKRAKAASNSVEGADEPFDLKLIEDRLATLRRDIDALGPVNLEADDQLTEMTSRIETQSRERDDLFAAISKLQEGVEALNKEGAARLLAAFEEVAGHFKSLFETLFQGGEAQLKLTESDDPLEAGLEIYACPPGKRMGALSLMSGGEQALTATALIFAVFLSRPSPLCVLDEVDAPLDDANVDRYCRMLDEMRRRTDTRFIVITHNAVTMSRMDRLFGVTMQERGVSRLVSVDLQAAEQLVAAE